MQHPGKRNIVHEAARARDKARVFAPQWFKGMGCQHTSITRWLAALGKREMLKPSSKLLQNQSMPSPTRSLSVSQLLQRLTLRQLRAFMAVAEVSSMTQAAALMHLTPSAMSMLIKSLEEELGLQLFERTTRKLLLTESATHLLPVVQAVFENLESAVEQLRNQSDQRAQQFVIATSPLMAASLLPGLIASFCKMHPQVQIRLIDTAVDAVAGLVRSGKADVGICTLDHDFSDLKNTALMEDSLMLACHPSHPLATLKPIHAAINWEQLLGERLILLSKGSGLRHLVDQTLNKLPIKARKQIASVGIASVGQPADTSYEVAHVATAVGLVRSGQGISVLPAYALNRALAEQKNSLVVRSLIKPVVKRKIVALSVKERPLQKNAQLFLAHFKKSVAAGV
jgi:LysR family transcriptional regulator, carnitine catabolism transcriptional activator